MQNYIKNKFNPHFYIQWGSGIWTSLDFEWSKLGWVANGADFDWELKSGSPTIRNPYKWLQFY